MGGQGAKEEIDLVVEKFDDLRKFVDSEGVQQHMQATRVAAAKLVKSLVGSVASLKEASEDVAEKTDWASKFEREAAKMKSSLEKRWGEIRGKWEEAVKENEEDEEEEDDDDEGYKSDDNEDDEEDKEKYKKKQNKKYKDDDGYKSSDDKHDRKKHKKEKRREHKKRDDDDDDYREVGGRNKTDGEWRELNLRDSKKERRTTMMKATNLMTMTMMKRTRRNTRRSKTRNTKMTMTTMTKKTRRRNTKRNRRERRRRMMTMTTT